MVIMAHLPPVIMRGSNVQRWSIEPVGGRNLSAYAAPYGVPTRNQQFSHVKAAGLGLSFGFH
jgi:hypothetical protein